MIDQKKEADREYRRKFYNDPANNERLKEESRGMYLTKIERGVECTPDYGVCFDCVAIQLSITNWGTA